MSVHPAATVVERRDTIGQVTLLDVACPFGRHGHTVGLAEPTAVLWCSHTGRHYSVSVPPEGDR